MQNTSTLRPTPERDANTFASTPDLMQAIGALLVTTIVGQSAVSTF